MPFDLTFTQVIGRCRGDGKSSATLLDELAAWAKQANVPVPDHTFRSALPWALAQLAQAGRIESEFSKEDDAFLYSASDEQVDDAAKDQSLDVSVRDSYARRGKSAGG